MGGHISTLLLEKYVLYNKRNDFIFKYRHMLKIIWKWLIIKTIDYNNNSRTLLFEAILLLIIIIVVLVIMGFLHTDGSPNIGHIYIYICTYRYIYSPSLLG